MRASKGTPSFTVMGKTLLEIRDLTCPSENGTEIFSKLNFKVNEGDIVVLQGKSGSG